MLRSMTTSQLGITRDPVEREIAENVNTLLHRARMSRRELSLALGHSQATFARKVAGGSPWHYVEVREVAAYFGVTTDELATGLPSLSEWQTRWDELCACRDSNPKPSVWEPRLIVGSVKHDLTPDRRTAAHHPSCPARVGSGACVGCGRHLVAVAS